MGASIPPDTTPIRDLSALLPEVADSAASLQRAAAAAGVRLTPVETRRSQERQNYLYDKGRSTPGEQVTWTLHSNHTPGAAVDFLVNNDWSGSDPGYQWLQQEAPKHGFGVLGSKDPGHVEMPSAANHSAAPAQWSASHGTTGTWGGSATPPPLATSRTAAPSAASVSSTSAGSTSAVHIAGAPNVELELAKLANDAMAGGADPHDVTGKLHQTITYLRQFPHMAEHANNALADGVASPADISRTLWPHVSAMSHAQGSNAPTETESAALPNDVTPRSRFGGGLASFVSGVPGGEALTTGAHALLHGESYGDAYRSVKAAENTSPIKGALKFAGAIPAALAMPGNAAVSGALIGGADEAFDANPDASLMERGVKTAIGAGAGALIGKTFQKIGMAGRSLLPVALGGAGGADANLIARQAARAASAKQLYAAAMNEGHANGITPEIQQFLAEEDIAPLVERIQSGRTGKTLATPELLDRVYKELSDMQKTAGKPLAQYDPSKPNLAVSRLADIKAAKQQGLSAISGTPSAPGPMPSYQQAVEDYAQRTREIDALKRGYQAVQQRMGGNLPSVNSLGRKTPLAFAEWAKTATPEQLAAARQGVSGAARDALALPGKTLAPFRKAVSVGAPLVRNTAPPNQEWTDALRNLGLLEVGNKITSP